MPAKMVEYVKQSTAPKSVPVQQTTLDQPAAQKSLASSVPARKWCARTAECVRPTRYRRVGSWLNVCATNGTAESTARRPTNATSTVSTGEPVSSKEPLSGVTARRVGRADAALLTSATKVIFNFYSWLEAWGIFRSLNSVICFNTFNIWPRFFSGSFSLEF